MGLLIGKIRMHGLLGERFIKRFNEILKSYRKTNTPPAEKAQTEDDRQCEKPPDKKENGQTESQTGEK
jgi:hypothetical protein